MYAIRTYNPDYCSNKYVTWIMHCTIKCPICLHIFQVDPLGKTRKTIKSEACCCALFMIILKLGKE